MLEERREFNPFAERFAIVVTVLNGSRQPRASWPCSAALNSVTEAVFTAIESPKQTLVFRPDAYPYYKPNERENPKINPSAPVIEAISWRSDPGLW